MSAELRSLFNEYQSLKKESAPKPERLSSLESQLFAEGRIFEDPGLLVGLDVAIRQGEEGAESTSYFLGRIVGIEVQGGHLKEIVLREVHSDSTGQTRMIPYHPNITFVAGL